MLEVLKELKNRVIGYWQPEVAGEDDYQKMEYTVQRHLHTPQSTSPLTYEEQARIKTVIYH
ncbi:hypothetical protein R70723_26720 [Paenibacillus sp. FSL R7-0273]|uniref:hypothetical protein n=1 Tax=Paenibacillus sp. FSL R7-0273 TaxID=1536772 RepID=UPI0004F83988|nr:hypothetical protein [Paenibacillus sp. FSL R7-0273]AIQ49099.1 hypothetical protein R70723_26720 [Paenibacillus sp. FSL R7-0273]OMF87218.1 hypothetical protein BK144_24625 [Paenibacillus sp. FSL R7-0273]